MARAKPFRSDGAELTLREALAGIVRKLKQQSEWRMELLDASRKPVFRIRVLAETLDRSATSTP